MATYSSVLAWRIPGMGEPGGLLSMGLHRVGHDSSDLAAAANLWKQASSGQTRGYLDSQLPLCGTQLCVHATSIQTSLYHSLAVVVSDQEKCPPLLVLRLPRGTQGWRPRRDRWQEREGAWSILDPGQPGTGLLFLLAPSLLLPTNRGLSLSQLREEVTGQGPYPRSVQFTVQGHLTSQHRMLSSASGLRFWDLQGISGGGGRCKTRGPWGRLKVQQTHSRQTRAGATWTGVKGQGRTPSEGAELPEGGRTQRGKRAGTRHQVKLQLTLKSSLCLKGRVCASDTLAHYLPGISAQPQLKVLCKVERNSGVLPGVTGAVNTLLF